MSELQIVFWSTMIIQIFTAFMIFIMNLWLTFHFCYIKNSVFYIIKTTAIISLLFSTICILVDFVHIEQAYTLNKPIHKNAFHEIRAIADSFMFLSLISFFINLYVRLIKAFNDTPFSLSNTFKIFSFLLLSVVIILDAIYISLVLFHWEKEFDAGCDHIYHGHIYGLFTYFQLVLFVMIVGAFTFKVKTVYHTLYVTRFNDKYHVNMNGNGENEESKVLLSMITKHNILSLISLLLFLIRFTYRQCLAYFDENNLSEYLWFISYIGRDIVLLSTAMFIYMTIKFNSNQYYIVCKYCDNCCAAICISYITKNTSQHPPDATDGTSENITVSTMEQTLTQNGDHDIYNMDKCHQQQTMATQQLPSINTSKPTASTAAITEETITSRSVNPSSNIYPVFNNKSHCKNKKNKQYSQSMYSLMEKHGKNEIDILNLTTNSEPISIINHS